MTIYYPGQFIGIPIMVNSALRFRSDNSDLNSTVTSSIHSDFSPENSTASELNESDHICLNLDKIQKIPVAPNNKGANKLYFCPYCKKQQKNCH